MSRKDIFIGAAMVLAMAAGTFVAGYVLSHFYLWAIHPGVEYSDHVRGI